MKGNLEARGKSGRGGSRRGMSGQRGFISPGLVLVCQRVFGVALALHPSTMACGELPENCEAGKRREEEEAKR